MSNEEQIEEILTEAHKLGLDKQIFTMYKNIVKENPRIDRVNAYEIALKNLKENEKMVYSTK
jgi:hypothetical protein